MEKYTHESGVNVDAISFELLDTLHLNRRVENPDESGCCKPGLCSDWAQKSSVDVGGCLAGGNKLHTGEPRLIFSIAESIQKMTELSRTRETLRKIACSLQIKG